MKHTLIYKALLICCISIISISCISDQPTLNFDDEILSEYFSKENKRVLKEIISYVDSIVRSRISESDIERSYHAFLDSVRFSEDAKYGAVNEEMKYEYLESLDTSVFNDIWIKDTPPLIWTIDTVLYSPECLESLWLNGDGKFVEMIGDLGEENEIYKNYHERIMMQGSLSPTVYGGFLVNHEEFNFNNIHDRLWAAVFILCIEESVERKVERYLSKQIDPE